MRSAGNKAFSDHIHSLSLFQGLDCEWDFPTSSSWRLYNRSDNLPIPNSNNVHQESFCEPKSRSHLARELLLGFGRMNWRIMHQLLRLAWGFFSGTAFFQKLLAAEWISASSSSAPSSTTSGRWSATSSPPSRSWTSTRVSGDFTIRLLKVNGNPSKRELWHRIWWDSGRAAVPMEIAQQQVEVDFFWGTHSPHFLCSFFNL